jgi:hypothetical protein
LVNQKKEKKRKRKRKKEKNDWFVVLPLCVGCSDPEEGEKRGKGRGVPHSEEEERDPYQRQGEKERWYRQKRKGKRKKAERWWRKKRKRWNRAQKEGKRG